MSFALSKAAAKLVAVTTYTFNGCAFNSPGVYGQHDSPYRRGACLETGAARQHPQASSLLRRPGRPRTPSGRGVPPLLHLARQSWPAPPSSTSLIGTAPSRVRPQIQPRLHPQCCMGLHLWGSACQHCPGALLVSGWRALTGPVRPPVHGGLCHLHYRPPQRSPVTAGPDVPMQA